MIKALQTMKNNAFLGEQICKDWEKNDEACHALFYYGLLSNVHVKRESSSSTEVDQLLTLDSREIQKTSKRNFLFFNRSPLDRRFAVHVKRKSCLTFFTKRFRCKIYLKKIKIDGHFGELCYISRLESALGLEGAGFEVLLS